MQEHVSQNSHKSWFEDNVSVPVFNALVRGAYEPLATTVNFLTKGTSTSLPEVRLIDEPEAAQFSVENLTRIVSGGVVSATCYAAAGRIAGGALRAFGNAAKIEGAAARVLANQSTGQILGGAIHDGLINAPDAKTRLTQAAMGAVSMSAFEGVNHFSAKSSLATRLVALGATGAAVGAGESIVSQRLANQNLSWSQVEQSAFASGAVSALLPGAQWGIGRVVDGANNLAGRGVPLHTYVQGLDAKSANLDRLVRRYPLARVQVADIDANSVEHETWRVDLKRDAGPNELAHELAHIEARSVYEPEFKRAAELLKTAPDAARQSYIEARIKQEEDAIKCGARKDSPLQSDHREQILCRYSSIFANEFERFEKSNGTFRPERDFELVSSDVRDELEANDKPRDFVKSLYPELRLVESESLIDALDSFKAAYSMNSFDIAWGLKRTGWSKALTSSVAEYCVLNLMLAKRATNVDPVQSHPLIDKLTKTLEPAVDRYLAEEQIAFFARKHAYDDQFRSHEFWQIEHEKIQQRYNAADFIADLAKFRASKRLEELTADAKSLDPRNAARLTTLVEREQEKLEHEQELFMLPYTMELNNFKIRAAQSGVDLRRDVDFANRGNTAIVLDESRWLRAQSEFGKSFAKAVAGTLQEDERYSEGKLRIPDYVLNDALSVTLASGKNADQWWQERAFWKGQIPLNLPVENTATLDGMTKVVHKFKSPTDHRPLQRALWNWWRMQPAERKSLSTGSIDNLLDVTARYEYPDATVPALAAEAMKWGVFRNEYRGIETPFLRGSDVPDAFPTDQRFTSGNLVGRFLKRTDPRIPFLGEYTNCCLKVRGMNERGLWWTLHSPDAGFFVVEDGKGQILASSRLWIVPESKGVSFNNVESKGLGARRTDAIAIYKKVADALLAEKGIEVVTMGAGHNDLEYGNVFEPCEKLPLPVGMKGMNDVSQQQVLLAKVREKQ